MEDDLYEVPPEEPSDKGTCARSLYDYQAGELDIFKSSLQYESVLDCVCVLVRTDLVFCCAQELTFFS